MLKKECCKRCWNSTDYGWDESDEGWWKEGVICCPYKYIGKGEPLWISIIEKPPSKCPFFLEHVLNNQ